jgi:hypothetical protein
MCSAIVVIRGRLGAMMEALPARSQDMGDIVAWLCEPAIYRDAFWLASPPEPAWIRRSMLMVENNLGVELQRVRFWSLLAGGELLGFAIDFGWDSPDDTVREIDFALPRSNRRRFRAPLEALAGVAHQLFGRGATAVWGRVRVGNTGRGFPRLFALLGAELQGVRDDEMPTTGEVRRRAYFRAIPGSFYASRFGRQISSRRPATTSASRELPHR